MNNKTKDLVSPKSGKSEMQRTTKKMILIDTREQHNTIYDIMSGYFII